jgi:CubicO group peptidase (beta-lactamase class C family)
MLISIPGAQGDFINSELDPTSVGLPPNISRDGLPECDEYSPNYETPCSAEGARAKPQLDKRRELTGMHVDLFKIVKNYRPLFAPNQASTYSNLAYEILGLVLSRVSNQTYEDYINDAMFKPLNMSKSTLSKPPDSAGVIPLNPQFWDVSEGVQNPTGGIYSSSSDLSKYLRYVLTHFNALTPALNWLHPVSASRGLCSFYGMPWEIFQTDRILKDSKRTVRFVTKSGGLPGYTSIIMTVPEYDLGITILVAGPPTFFENLREIVSVATVRAAEDVAIRQLASRYAGTYSSTDPDLNSTITLKADHRGLVITTFISNGTDLRESPIARQQAPGHWYAQLSPTLLYRDEKKLEGEEWAMMIAYEREGLGAIWDDFCTESVEMSMYAGISFGAAVFWDERGDGKMGTLEMSAFRVNLTRVDDKEAFGYEGQETMEL